MIILVRHGEATHHIHNLTGGWTDSDLTPVGEEQMRILAKQLAKSFTGKEKPKIFASDLHRSFFGAQIIAKALGNLPVVSKKFLREKNNGKAAGLTETAARKYYHGPVDGRELDHKNYDEGETRREFFKRCRKGFQEILPAAENIIIVSHKGAIQNMLFAWLGLSIEDVYAKNISFDIRPASVTILGINRWREHTIFSLNDTSYLSEKRDLAVFDYKYLNRISR